MFQLWNWCGLDFCILIYFFFTLTMAGISGKYKQQGILYRIMLILKTTIFRVLFKFWTKGPQHLRNLSIFVAIPGSLWQIWKFLVYCYKIFFFGTEFWLLIVINDVYYNFRGSLLWQIWRTCVNLLAENFAIIEHSRRELQALIVALKYEKGANLGESSKLMCFSNFSLIDQLGNDPRKL